MADVHDGRLLELVGELGGEPVRDLFRDLLERSLQELIDAELTGAIGAEPHERTESRTNQRNGGRPRTLSTPAGDVELRLPKVRVGFVLPLLAGTPSKGGSCVVGGDRHRLCDRHLDP